MAFQLPDPKVPIFPGINDSPIAPTPQSAGNGADLIAKHNLLVDILNFTLNAQPELISYQTLNQILTLTQATTWYVDPVNGRDDNDGLSRETAFLTLSRASAVAAGYLNPFNYGRSIQLLPGIYNDAYLTGYNNIFLREDIFILGDYNNPDSVQINDTLYHFGGGVYRIQGVTFNTASSSSYCLMVDNSKLQLQKVRFTGEAFTHIYATNHALIEVLDQYIIAGSARDCHIKLNSFSHLNFLANDDESRGIIIDSNLSFKNFVVLTRNSYLSARRTIFTNSVVGSKFLADGNSTIDTDGENINFFPGDTPGVLTKNSYYF